MSHEIATVNGKSAMFSVSETPWHRLGQVVSAAPDIESAIGMAGQDWETVEEELYRKDANGNFVSVSEFGKAHVRFDKNPDNTVEEVTLGVVGPNTAILQNRKAFDWFQPFLDKNLATLETAGALGRGERIWVLAKLNSDNSEIVKGDEVAKFLMLSNAHDGSQGVKIGFTPIRIVCANTLAAAHHSAASKLIRISHSRHMADNMDKLREVVNAANANFEANAEQFRFLASKGINGADVRKYIKIMLNADVDDKELKTRKANTIDDLMGLFEKGKGNNIQGVRGTWWAAYNAYTEYLSWEKGTSASTRYNSLWFGTGVNDNLKALKVAMEGAERKGAFALSA